MADKIIYMRPGETLEIRHLTHEDFDRNAKSWQAQTRPERDLIRINRPHSITPATPMLECNHWKTWGDTQPPSPEVNATGEVWRDGLGKVTPKPAHADAVLEDMGYDPSPTMNVRVTDSFGNDLIERELVSIVLRMSRHLLAVETPAAKKLNEGVLDYLRRKGLMPSPLRTEDTVTRSAPAPETNLMAMVEQNRKMIARWKEIIEDGPEGNEPLGNVVRKLEQTTDALAALSSPAPETKAVGFNEIYKALNEWRRENGLHDKDMIRIARKITALFSG